MSDLLDLIVAAERPLVIGGAGIRSSGAVAEFRKFVSRVPHVLTWGGADLCPTADQNNIGIIGIAGQPGANKCVYAADLLLCIGTHLHLTQTTTLTRQFAPNAKKIVVNIDKYQLDNLTVEVDLKICEDAKEFFARFPECLQWEASSEWHEDCKQLKALNSIPVLHGDGTINSYTFNDMMTRSLPDGTVMVVDGGGTALYTGMQSSCIQPHSRLICSTGVSAMGSGLPEAVGSCLANGRKLTTCLIGDGSLMLNLQELQTIKTLNLPIKIFVISNGGYLAIRHTQKAFLGGRYYGSEMEFPAWYKVAEAFGIAYCWCDSIESAKQSIDWALHKGDPMIVEVLCPPDQPMLWSQGYQDNGDGTFSPKDLNEMVTS
jgi:acetolactate synthase-1/2/3 large subunit